jgi:hypothetical protein
LLVFFQAHGVVARLQRDALRMDFSTHDDNTFRTAIISSSLE